MTTSTSAQTPATSPTGPSSTNLTDTSTITWDKVPMAEVIKVAPGLSEKAFSAMNNITTRMQGRALGRISNIKFTLMPKPGYLMAAAICYVPVIAGSSNAPTQMEHIASLGGCFVHYSPHGSSLSGAPLFMPGVTNYIKGATTTLLAGGPPHIFVYLEMAKLDGSTPSTSVTSFLQVTYDLEMSGYDHIKGF
jgi:hypothetical protein